MNIFKTYSGLSYISINPYRHLPIFTTNVMDYYRSKKRKKAPPHLYLVANGAFSAMTRDRKNQSILFTGESGSGKTVNTNKILQYISFIASEVYFTEYFVNKKKTRLMM